LREGLVSHKSKYLAPDLSSPSNIFLALSPVKYLSASTIFQEKICQRKLPPPTTLFSKVVLICYLQNVIAILFQNP